MKKNIYIIVIFIGVASCRNTGGDYLIRVHDADKDKYGYVNTKGDTVIPMGKYLFCFTDTLKHYAIVLSPDMGFVCIDRHEQIKYTIFPFDNGPDYPSEGLFRIIKDGKIGYADVVTGEIVIEPQFCAAFPFQSGAAKVAYKCRVEVIGEYHSWVSNEWFFIDKSGQMVENPAPDDYQMKIPKNRYAAGTERFRVELLNHSKSTVSTGDYYRIDRLTDAGQWKEVEFTNVAYHQVLYEILPGGSAGFDIWLYSHLTTEPYEAGIYRVVKTLDTENGETEIEAVFEIY